VHLKAASLGNSNTSGVSQKNRPSNLTQVGLGKKWLGWVNVCYFDKFREIVDNLCSLIDKKGTDCWWESSVEEIVPESVLNKIGVGYDDIEIGKV